MTDSIDLWNFVKNATADKSGSCELYHFYDAKNVHKRSISYQGVDTIWQHFLKWDHVTKELIYYDGRNGRDGSKFKEIITKDNAIFDDKTKKIFINIQPRDMLIWTWCYDPNKEYMELRCHEKKVCPHCDPEIKIHYNGGYDYRYVKEFHLQNCPHKEDLPKRGLQDKFYYIYYDLKKASKHKPLDRRQMKTKNILEWSRDSWGIIITDKKELSLARKYFESKKIENQYTKESITMDKSEMEKIKHTIRETINRSNLDNVESTVDILKQFKDINERLFISNYLYKTYKTFKEYPHVEIIKRLDMPLDILDFFKKDLYSDGISEEKTKFLKFKICLISILYKNKLLNKESIIDILSKITVAQAEIIIYFFVQDSKFGLQIGLVHENVEGFKPVIKKLQEFYDELSTKSQFAIDDILDI